MKPNTKKKFLGADSIFNPLTSLQQVTNFEFFDDRFYKFIFGKIPSSELTHIPHRLIEQERNNTIVYFPSATTIIGGGQPTPFGIIKKIGRVGLEQSEYEKHIAGLKGSRVHEATALLDTNKTALVWEYADLENKELKKQIGRKKKYLMTQEELLLCMRYKNILDIVKPELISSEFKVFNWKYCYAGTLDRVWKIKEGVYDVRNNLVPSGSIYLPEGNYIIDLKTGYVEEKYLMQSAAYSKAFESLEGNIITGTIIVDLKADSRTGIPGTKFYISFNNNEYNSANYKHKKSTDDWFNSFLNRRNVFMDENPDVRPKNMEIPQVIVLNTGSKKKTKKTNSEIFYEDARTQNIKEIKKTFRKPEPKKQTRKKK